MAIDRQDCATFATEILRFAMAPLEQGTESGRRMALVLIDEACAQALRTFLTGPASLGCIAVGRAECATLADSYAHLLPALREHAPELDRKLPMGAFADMRCERRLLDVEGHGRHVAPDVVERYAQLTQLLIETLFDVEIGGRFATDVHVLRRATSAWAEVREAELAAGRAHGVKAEHNGYLADALADARKISLEDIRQLRATGRRWFRVLAAKPHSGRDLSETLVEDMNAARDALLGSARRARR